MSVAYTVQIEEALAEQLEEAARTTKISATELITECVAQHLEVAIRHRTLVDRLEAVDQGLLELASFIGEATAGSNVDLSKMCHYSPTKA